MSEQCAQNLAQLAVGVGAARVVRIAAVPGLGQRGMAGRAGFGIGGRIAAPDALSGMEFVRMGDGNVDRVQASHAGQDGKQGK